MIKKAIAAITIGQSPRSDMTADIFQKMPADLEIIEYGALDPYSAAALTRFSPDPDDEVLVSRLRDGSQIRLSGNSVAVLLQDCIDRAQAEGAAAILLLCTGELPEFRHSVPLIVPMPLLHMTARLLSDGRKIAVMVPDPDQVRPSAARWSESGIDVQVVQASPYLDIASVEIAAKTLRNCGASLLCMDCMGYTLEMKRLAANASGLPVLLPRTLIAAITSEFLSLL